MKATKILSLLVISFCLNFVNAQDLEMDWTQKLSYTNGKDGFFSHFIGTNEEYIYAIYSNLALKKSKQYDKAKLIVFNKSTMSKVGSVALRGFKDNGTEKSTYRDLEYVKTIILKDKVFVFWSKKASSKSSKKEEMFVESFSEKLERDGKLKKVFTRNIPKEIKTSRFAESSLVVMSNKNVGDKIIIGAEEPSKGDNVAFNFVEMNEELETSEEFKIELPIESPSKSYGLTSDYQYGNDGNIYVRSYITLSREERKNAPKGANMSYCVLSLINTETSDVSTFDIKDDNKRIIDFKIVVSDREVKIYGFFGDLMKDPKGTSTHGIFYTTINSKTLEANDLAYTYFDKKTIDKLFANDEEDKKKTSGGRKKKEKAKENDDSALDVRFGIESIFVTPENDVVLFCSKMYNYSVTTCTSNSSGGQSCTTRYYCEKSNVTALKVSTEGEIVWASNLDRKITYNGTAIEDLKVAFKNDKYYVIYGSSYKIDADSKKSKNKKRNAEMRDNFEYAIFDASTGEYNKNNFLINDKNTVKKERKYVSPTAITILDDNFYVNYMTVRQQIGWCVANVICFPTAYYSFLSGDTKVGSGYLGVIKILD
jgi:hypothetical protein